MNMKSSKMLFYILYVFIYTLKIAAQRQLKKKTSLLY